MNKIAKLMVGTTLLAASVAASAWNFGNDSWSWGKDYSYNSGPYNNSWGGGPWGNNNRWGGNRWGGNDAPWNWGNGRNGWGGNSTPWNWGNGRNGWGGNNWGGNNAPWNWGNNNRRYYGGPGSYGANPYGPGYGAPAPMYGSGPGNDFDPAANPYINPPAAPEAPVEQPTAPATDATVTQ